MGFAPHCTEQSIRPLFGKTMTEIAQVVVPGVPQEQAMEVMDRCMDGEMARLRRDPCHIFYPGVKETLTELHKTHRLFIVSNCQQGYIELLMEKGGLGGLISDFDCFGNTGLPKGQTLRLLCERCNVRDAVYVGDTQGDMEASEQAGLPSCGRPTASASPRTGISASIILPICCASEAQIVPWRTSTSTMHTARTASAPSHTARRALDRHAAGRFARRQQVRMAQSLHDGLVEQHGDRGVQAALEQVERQEHRHEHRGDVGAGRVHVQRRDEIVPQQHEHGHKQRAAEQARNGAALRALLR